MKYLLLLVVALLVVWLLRRALRRLAKRPAEKVPAPPEREAIVACAHCGLLLPAGEALPGRGGVFCSDAHRAAASEQPPPAA